MKKLSLSKDGLNNLARQHVEKLIFFVAVLLVVVFIYFGYKLEGFSEAKTPDDLQRRAQMADENIETVTWDVVKEERTPAGQYAIRAVDSAAKTAPAPYSIDLPWDPPTGKPGVKRTDPEFLAVSEIEASVVVGALATPYEEDALNPVADLENAKPKAQRKRRTKTKRSNSPYGGDGGDEENMYGGEGMEGGEGSGFGETPVNSDPIRYLSKRRGFVPKAPVDPGAGFGDGEFGGGGPGNLGGAGGGAGEPGGDDTSYGGGFEGAPTGPPPAIARSSAMIVVKAVFPYKDQMERYKTALGDAMGWLPSRDRPNLIYFRAQRVDVTDDPTREITEDEWNDPNNAVSSTNLSERYRKNWLASPDEIAESRYTNEYVTMPAPPIMMREFDEYMLHSKVPRTEKSASTDEFEGYGGGGDDNSGEGDNGDDGDDDGGYGDGGSGEGYPGAGGGYPGGGDGGYPGGGDGGYPGGGDGGYPGGGDGGSSYSSTADDPEFMMVRFTDPTVEVGHAYRYRIQVLLEDPNNPNTDSQRGKVRFAPRRRSLSDEVLTRLTEQRAKAETEKRSVPYWIETAWSEPSAPITVKMDAKVFAGGVSAARYSTASDGTPIVQRETRGTVVPVVWDPQFALDVSQPKEFYRGSVLNAKGDFEVVDPVTLVIKVRSDFDLRTDTLVADIRGGEELPGSTSKNRIYAPGEFALITPDGQFVVRNELDDYADYQWHTLADEAQSSTSADGDGLPGGGLGGSGGSGAGGEPGNSGGEGGGDDCQ